MRDEIAYIDHLDGRRTKQEDLDARRNKQKEKVKDSFLWNFSKLFKHLDYIGSFK